MDASKVTSTASGSCASSDSIAPRSGASPIQVSRSGLRKARRIRVKSPQYAMYPSTSRGANLDIAAALLERSSHKAIEVPSSNGHHRWGSTRWTFSPRGSTQPVVAPTDHDRVPCRRDEIRDRGDRSCPGSLRAPRAGQSGSDLVPVRGSM